MCDVVGSPDTLLSGGIPPARSVGRPPPWSTPHSWAPSTVQLWASRAHTSPWAHSPALSSLVASVLAGEKPSQGTSSALLAFLEAWLPDLANTQQRFYQATLARTHPALPASGAPVLPCLFFDPLDFSLFKFSCLLHCLNVKNFLV